MGAPWAACSTNSNRSPSRQGAKSPIVPDNMKDWNNRCGSPTASSTPLGRVGPAPGSICGTTSVATHYFPGHLDTAVSGSYHVPIMNSYNAQRHHHHHPCPGAELMS